MDTPRFAPEAGGFARRVTVALCILTLFIGAGWVIAVFPGIPLLIFASVLGAIALSSLAQPLCRHLRFPRTLAVLTIVLGVGGLVFAGLWFGGPRMAQQIAQLAEQVPAALERLRGWIVRAPWGEAMMAQLSAADIDFQSVSSLLTGVFKPLASAFGITLSAISAGFVCGIMATFLAIEPKAYLRPMLCMVRRDRRARVREILEATGNALQSWLVARLLSMAVIAVLTFLGLMLLGVSEALVLSVLAGVLCFIPYIGPVLSAVPAVLATLASGGADTLWVLMLYGGIQVIESNLLTPIIERHAVSIPPAGVLAAQLLLGVPFGFLGLLLATPLAVSAIVAIQGFYLEDVLGERVQLLGEQEPEEAEPRERAASLLDGDHQRARDLDRPAPA